MGIIKIVETSGTYTLGMIATVNNIIYYLLKPVNRLFTARHFPPSLMFVSKKVTLRVEFPLMGYHLVGLLALPQTFG